MSTPEPKRHPKAPGPIIVYHKRDAARTQLETAIALWFRYADPMAIHTLAAAANEVYHGIGRTKGAPGIVQTFKKNLKTKREKNLLNMAQNFGKHANTDPDGTFRLRPEHAELLLLDGVMTHERLFRSRTPLMTCFFARLAFERFLLRQHINEGRRKEGRSEIVIDESDKRDREEFLREELPAILAEIADGKGGPLHEPPP